MTRLIAVANRTTYAARAKAASVAALSPASEIDAQIGAVLLPHDRRLGHQRIRRAHDRGQRVVDDHEVLGGVHRLSERLGDDHRDRLADIADLLDGQNRVRSDQKRRAVAALERHLVWVRRHRPVRDRPQTVPYHIDAGQHRDHSRCAGGRPDIDAGDPRMRVRRAKQIGIGLARKVDVVGIVSGAGQQPRVLAPPNRFADPLPGSLLPRSQERHRPSILHVGRGRGGPVAFLHAKDPAW